MAVEFGCKGQSKMWRSAASFSPATVGESHRVELVVQLRGAKPVRLEPAFRRLQLPREPFRLHGLQRKRYFRSGNHHAPRITPALRSSDEQQLVLVGNLLESIFGYLSCNYMSALAGGVHEPVTTSLNLPAQCIRGLFVGRFGLTRGDLPGDVVPSPQEITLAKIFGLPSIASPPFRHIWTCRHRIRDIASGNRDPPNEVADRYLVRTPQWT
jgi:hypothetical protein